MALIDFVHRGLDHFHRAIAHQIRDLLADNRQINLLQRLLLHVEAFFGVLRPLLVLALFIVPLTWLAYPILDLLYQKVRARCGQRALLPNLYDLN